jgi:2-keto-4-pentenoate hydratase
VWIGHDVPPGGPDDQVRRSLSALAPAIELADVDPPPEAVEDILVGNIFHRGVVLGDKDASRSGARLDGLEPRITLGGGAVAPPADLEELTGRIVEVVSHLALLLADHSETIRAGDVVICGSVTPPLPLSEGTTVEFELSPFPTLTVHTA